MPVRLTPWALLSGGAILLSGQASAAFVVSHDPTAHVACVPGACQATAPDAVLNSTVLESMLSSGAVTLMAKAGSRDLVIAGRLRWLAASVLTLKAPGAVVIDHPVSVAGYGGGLAVSSNAKSNRGIVFGTAGALTYVHPEYGTLSINGTAYQLVASVQSLSAAVAANPTGAYALAASYDASADGTYSAAPVVQDFMGTFEGLGNTISHLSVSAQSAGLFATVFYGGSVRDLWLTGARISGGDGAMAGILAASSDGDLTRIRVAGTVTVGAKGVAGGLVGELNSATALHCSSSAHVTGGDGAIVGGLVGESMTGTVAASYAIAAVTGGAGAYGAGLVGAMSRSAVQDSYARGEVVVGASGYAGGITAYLGGSATRSSYSIAQLKGDVTASMGGLIGTNSSAPPPNTSVIDTAYWDVVTSGQVQGVGAGPGGGTGLTTAQLKTGLPAGFSTAIWGSKTAVNDGLPYLLAVVPR